MRNTRLDGILYKISNIHVTATAMISDGAIGSAVGRVSMRTKNAWEDISATDEDNEVAE